MIPQLNKSCHLFSSRVQLFGKIADLRESVLASYHSVLLLYHNYIIIITLITNINIIILSNYNY